MWISVPFLCEGFVPEESQTSSKYSIKYFVLLFSYYCSEKIEQAKNNKPNDTGTKIDYQVIQLSNFLIALTTNSISIVSTSIVAASLSCVYYSSIERYHVSKIYFPRVLKTLVYQSKQHHRGVLALLVDQLFK